MYLLAILPTTERYGRMAYLSFMPWLDHRTGVPLFLQVLLLSASNTASFPMSAAVVLQSDDIPPVSFHGCMHDGNW